MDRPVSDHAFDPAGKDWGAPSDGPTIAANRARAYPEQFVVWDYAAAMSRRAFWRGLFAGVVLTAAIGSLAAVLT